MEIDFLLSKTKTGRRKNIVPIEVKSAKRYTQISLDKFCDKFRPYIDLPTVLYVNDRRAKDGVAYLCRSMQHKHSSKASKVSL